MFLIIFENDGVKEENKIVKSNIHRRKKE